MTSTHVNLFYKHNNKQLCPQCAGSTNVGHPSPPCRILVGSLPGKNGQRISLQFRVVVCNAFTSTSRETCYQPSRRHASTSAATRRVVALFVMPPGALHVEAANAVMSCSIAAENVAEALSHQALMQCTLSFVVYIIVTERVEARQSTRRIGTCGERSGTGEMRQTRRGSVGRAASGTGRDGTGHDRTRRT